MKKKKLFLIVFMIVVLIMLAINLPKEEKYDYLRIHIRANSNLEVDQNVKYEIKDKIVEYLTPMLANVPTKDKAKEIVLSNKQILENLCNNYLYNKGFKYSAKIKLTNEYFPTRTYVNTTLESGYYDAVVVELGDAVGDNWWCVMYPPLCFVNKNENKTQIKFKSKIAEWFSKLFK